MAGRGDVAARHGLADAPLRRRGPQDVPRRDRAGHVRNHRPRRGRRRSAGIAAPMSDANYMAMALSLARTAATLGETPVGCVIVDEATGEVVAGAANGPIGMTDPTA